MSRSVMVACAASGLSCIERQPGSLMALAHMPARPACYRMSPMWGFNILKPEAGHQGPGTLVVPDGSCLLLPLRIC